MPSHGLPPEITYAFAPRSTQDPGLIQVVITIEGVPGCIPTEMHATSMKDALELCDRFNAPLGQTRADAQRIAGQARAADMLEDLDPTRTH
ncbi:MAG: hypothetical protein OXE76_10430 [Alphaproteobacteria bacterium]|nr:hypothetical protein [Alphaproteobacteria bacterium]